ncbi:sigma-70 family RNA polymerase sigma factor [Sphingomonas changnyeongensis]|uniref:RNA polymerase sigma factor n=1 Tax=Sphingomonas changnyeongensis TaxID=2698679 RepID=A0A7Z2NV90_9SPHN|nr:sigma-70 family RNA polymerase sigma factor [Sphingomonas changnyeongensis]QHL90441.1 sigma-70 family RNA polymerase sigma factor [Sphingomonas changnyeongensis]
MTMIASRLASRLESIAPLLARAFAPGYGEGLPDPLARLLARLSAGGPAADLAFERELTALIPRLRAHARSLTRDAAAAEDLAQDSLMRAWAARDRFEPGSNLRAWLFMIQRNLFLTQRRRDKFAGAWDDAQAERLLVARPEQEAAIALREAGAAMAALPPAQREALLLVAACGYGYDEAAQAAGSRVGTMKSRVFRARAAMEAMLDGDVTLPDAPDAGPEHRVDAMIEAARAIGVAA